MPNIRPGEINEYRDGSYRMPGETKGRCCRVKVRHPLTEETCRRFLLTWCALVQCPPQCPGNVINILRNPTTGLETIELVAMHHKTGAKCKGVREFTVEVCQIRPELRSP